METIRELIAQLQEIEDKDQHYLGFVRIAEDFEFYNEESENEMAQPTSQNLFEVANWRSYQKAMYYFADEVNELVYKAMTEKSEVVA